MEETKDSDIDYFRLRMRKQFRRAEDTVERADKMDLNLGFTIRIPDGFVIENGNRRSQIFPTLFRPFIVFTNPAENAGITFQLLKESGFGEPAEFCEQIRKHIETVDSKTVFYETGMAGENKKIAWLEYKSFALDERVYNLLFLFLTDAGLVMGTFFSIFKDYADWKPVIFKMLDTVCVK